MSRFRLPPSPARRPPVRRTQPGRRLSRTGTKLAAALLAAAAGGCQGLPVQEQEAPARQAMDQSLRQSEQAAEPAPPQPPKEVLDELLPPIGERLPGAEPAEPRFDLAVNEAPARAFFMGLVQDTPYNMVVHPSVEGAISLDLKDVTVPEVMEVVRTVYGFEYQRTRTGFQVLPRRLRSRTFVVDYLNLQRSGKSHTRVSSGQVSERAGPSGTGAVTTVGGTGAVKTEPSTEINTEMASDFWAELTRVVRAIVGEGDGRSVVISPQSGVVVVRAMPGELREVEAYLQAAQGNLSRQVILEAKIVEVELSDRFQSGINWTLVGQRDGTSALLGHIGGGTVFDNGVAETSGDPIVLEPGSNLTGLETSAFGGAFAAALNLTDFNAFIELLKTQGDVQVLSSPRVATVNNQQAVIKVGSDEFFVTGVSSTTTSGTATAQSQDVELTPFFSGIALDVTPQIGADGAVTLHIHPTVSEVTDQTKEIVVGGTSQRLPLARSTVRESDSIVRAHSGQVIVIGGLMKNERNRRRAQTPVLGELPVLGVLFRHRQDTATKTELVILLRPVVVTGNRTWSQDIGRAARRLDQMSLTGRQGNPR